MSRGPLPRLDERRRNEPPATVRCGWCRQHRAASGGKCSSCGAPLEVEAPAAFEISPGALWSLPAVEMFSYGGVQVRTIGGAE